MEDSLNVKQIWDLLKKNKWIIFMSTCVCALLMSGYLYFFSTPIYQSETQVLINQSVPQNTIVQSQDVEANLQLINTYTSIIMSPRILAQVSEKMDDAYTTKELEEMIKVNSTSDSQVIKINVESADAADAVKIANETVSILSKDVPKIMKIDNIYTLSEATMDADAVPVKPHKTLMITVAILSGLILGVVITFLRDLFDRSIKTAEDVEETLGLPVLSMISEIKDGDLVEKVLGRKRKNRKG
ncbi:capsular polysaccharide biosynthesis protein [Listeria weihenstephanensis FSL R9-0317]|uniref:Capsular biosynthesis protein n=1 Tax=Listeria weihenstephanensis TaxID=1006155 RepID=A0A1S7FY85_9LIST|nr:Wzz/FepE/Etk N-terminal domain-containing protein [Listeria weihenstephanensis]AQY52349.1 capsular biosynthesis protein [Listeria weihenstephanensis]EUJ38247.1 capsular polysaccharide biosynthesis protein [Listeria weihenstephanensis FSL R9-0317]